MDIQISGDVLAWYAAITATASIAVSVVPLWHDRPRPIASAARDMILVGHGNDGTTKHVTITIANRGRRPISISQVALHDRRDQHVILLTDLIHGGPREVPEGKSTTLTCQQDQLNLDDIDLLLVTDAAGRRWRANFALNSDMPLKRGKRII